MGNDRWRYVLAMLIFTTALVFKYRDGSLDRLGCILWFMGLIVTIASWVLYMRKNVSQSESQGS